MLGNPFLSPILDRLDNGPDEVFGVFRIGADWISYSNAQFWERLSAFAGELRARGVTPGDIVFLILDHGIDASAAFIASMAIGAVPSFLPYPNVKQNHDDYWHQHAKIFSYAQPKAILCYGGLFGELKRCVDPLGIAVISAAEIGSNPLADLPELPVGASIALLQHSSGTTGLKKGVALSYDAIVGQLASYRRALQLDAVEKPIFTSWLPLYHDMGLVAAFLLPIWLGIPVISLDPFDWVANPTWQFEAIERYRATHAWLPNFAFMHLARRAPKDRLWDLSSLCALISCSEPCKSAAFDLFASRFHDDGIRPEMLQTCYAMAETVFAVSQSVPGSTVLRCSVDRAAMEEQGAIVIVEEGATSSLTLLSNGPAIEGCSVRIVKAGDTLPDRMVGEVTVRADFMFSGYFRNEDATAKAFDGDGWYKTGDLGFLHDAEVYLVGRIKDVIIVNGKNIFAHDVEACVNGIAGLKPGRSVAFGVFSERYGSEQLIVVAEVDGTVDDHEGLIRAINKAVLGDIGVPCSDIRIVGPDWLIKTTSGKISRASNIEKYRERLAA